MSIETWRKGDLISIVIEGKRRRAIVTAVEKDWTDPLKWTIRFIVDPDDTDSPSS